MNNRQSLLLTLLTLVILAFCAQFVIDTRVDNIVAACVVTISSMAVLLYLLWSRALDTHPLSTFAIFGFCFTTQMGALLIQSATGESLTLSLRVPLMTFSWLAFYQAIAMASHIVYRLFSKPPAARQRRTPELGLLRSALKGMGLYSTPTVGAMWIMAFIGLFALFVGRSPGTIGKLFAGISFLAWAPFLIPIYIGELGKGYARAGRQYLFVALYFSVIALFALAINARALMLAGLMTIALVVLLRVLRSTSAFNPKWLPRLAIGALVLGALSVPVTDMVTAMRLARKDRGNVSVVKMVENTFYLLQQPEKLRAQRAADRAISLRENYDEVYFDSPLAHRLVETKFHDNAMFFGSRLGDRDRWRIQDISMDFLWATLPEPWLKALDIKIDKEALGFSMGDYMSYLGGAGEVGGYRTGSGVAQGLAIFGPAFPIVMFCVFPILFWAMDLLHYRASDGQVLISALGMLAILKLFQYGVSAESLQSLAQLVLRYLPQSIIFYLIFFGFSRVLDAIFQGFSVTPKPVAVQRLA